MTEMMKRYEETTYLDDDPKALIQIIEYLKECIQDYKAKATAYDELKCTPNLPDEYNVFLVYLVRNRGDFHKTIRVLTDDGRCSLECMEWFAMMLGISWEPDWR